MIACAVSMSSSGEVALGLECLLRVLPLPEQELVGLSKSGLNDRLVQREERGELQHVANEVGETIHADVEGES